MLVEEKILEVGEDPQGSREASRQMQEETPGPCPVTPEADKCQQKHSTIQHNFGHGIPWPAVTFSAGKRSQKILNIKLGLNE